MGTKGHTDAVSSVAFSPDGRTLASASWDETLRLWDLRTHKQLGKPLTGHANRVESVAFSPDGRTLASASTDRTVRLWDVRTHKLLDKPLTDRRSSAFSVAFSPDGRTLASASTDKTVRIWKRLLWRNLGELQTEICNLVGGGLSQTEWTRYAAGIPYRDGCP
ncbi:MAG: WD40 repeat domain-containing protein [Solirubrobacteraceae bacterium]